MPQLFQVLRCYKCMVFQIHQTKKSNKFECKMCGEKQSIKRHYGLGTSKECRLHVQKLNGIRGEIDQLTEENSEEEIQNIHEDTPSIGNSEPNKSKWSDFVEKEKLSLSIPNETMYLDNAEVVLEIPKKRTKTFGCNKHHKSDSQTNTSEINLNKSYADDFNSKGNDNSVLNDATQVSGYANNSHTHITQDVDSAGTANNTNFTKSNFKLKSVPFIKEEKKVPKKFVPPKNNNNSKWAQFVDEEGNNDQDNSAPIIENSQSNCQGLFTLYDDADLDDILNI